MYAFVIRFSILKKNVRRIEAVYCLNIQKLFFKLKPKTLTRAAIEVFSVSVLAVWYSTFAVMID